ncbi:MAG: hypothetical protein TREMPRED_004943, partial [Tremellales sp. Tagirdzhanova-0007]
MFLALIVQITLVAARSGLYGNCSVSNNHLDANTKEFITDCDSFGYCAANDTCLPRLCRRDEFVLTSLLTSSTPAPPLCGPGSFCPDDASGCLRIVPVGGTCELNRDDECTPPIQAIVVPNPWGEEEGNGAICLLGKCMWGNVTIGSTCVTESTTYIGYD